MATKPRARSRYVYALLEPDGGIVRYVGLAVDPEARLRRHAVSDSAVGEWIRSLYAAGKHPIMCLLIEIAIPDLEQFPKPCRGSLYPSMAATALEAHFISHFHHLYKADLLNIQNLPNTPKLAWARSEGIDVDGEGYDKWLPEFQEAIENLPRKEMAIIDDKLVLIELPLIAQD